MTISECAKDCGRSPRTIQRWIKIHGIKTKRDGISRFIHIKSSDWEDFCEKSGVQRGLDKK